MKLLADVGTIVILVLAAAFSAVAVGEPAYSTSDPWFNPFLGKGLMSPANEVPRKYIKTVEENSEARALELLQSDSFRKLSQQELEGFGISATEDREGRQAFLIRALVLNPQSKFFEVFSNGGDVLVYHASLGRAPLPMTRRAIVVFLDAKPERVYISVGMAS